MLYFAGKNSNEMGVIVERTPSISKAKKRIERIPVAGRSGFLTIDQGVYESFIIAVECHLNDSTADVDAVMAWLDGSGKLSFDGIREWDAVVANSISLEKVANTFKKFLVQFEVQPISQDVALTTSTITTSPSNLSITGATAPMLPLVEVTGTGDVQITINGKSFNLFGLSGTYYLDSNLKVITDSLGNNISDKMLHDFPSLSSTNTISWTGTVTQIVLKYHKAYL